MWHAWRRFAPAGLEQFCRKHFGRSIPQLEKAALAGAQDAALATCLKATRRGGRIVQVGSPRDLYDRPINRYVADFVGKSNFFAGTIDAGGASLAGKEKMIAAMMQRWTEMYDEALRTGRNMVRRADALAAIIQAENGGAWGKVYDPPCFATFAAPSGVDAAKAWAVEQLPPLVVAEPVELEAVPAAKPRKRRAAEG